MTNVSDEEIGKLTRSWIDLVERLRKGSLGVDYASRGLQLTKEHKLPAYVNTYTLKVNYDQSVEEALKAGNYDWAKDRLVSEYIPPTRCGIEIVELHLIYFGRRMTSEEVLEEFEKQNLRPATIEELLALGASYPDLQRQFDIVALGSIWAAGGLGVSRDVPQLSSPSRKRWADMSWFDYGWDVDYRFLAVRK